MPSFLLWIAAAVAGPEIVVQEDGSIVATAVIDAPEAEVRAALADTRAAASLSPEILGVESEPHGSCERVTRQTRGLLRPLRLFSLRCPTEKGWREDLLEPGDFRVYSSEWVLESHGGGTRVEYRVNTQLGIPVPRAAVRAGLVESTKTLLDNLVRRVAPSQEG